MKCKKFLVQFVAAVCMLSCFTYWGEGIAPSEAVQVNGTNLGSIPDIVRKATGSDFPEIPKHSLLIFERHPNGSRFRYKSNIVLVSNDGSARKRFGDFVNDDSYYTPVDTATNVVQRMNVAISPKRFGMRRNVAFTTSGIDYEGADPDGLFGYQTLQSNGTETTANISTPSNSHWWYDGRQVWGVAALQVKGMENRDVFVTAHTTKMGQNGDLYFKFFDFARNESGNVGGGYLTPYGGDNGQGWKIKDYSDGIWGVDIAAGDFDGDGYKNEIVMAWNDNTGVYCNIYRVTSSNGNTVRVTSLLSDGVHTGPQNWGTEHWKQSAVAALAGDFDGDGIQEAAIVTKTNGLSLGDMRIKVFKYRSSGWTSSELSAADNQFWGTLKATRADLDGDGQDEIVVLVLQDWYSTTIYPRLEYWGFNRGSITPIRYAQYNKGGAGDTSVLGYSLDESNGEYSQYYRTAEEFCITAGPLTGTKGKAKLADDVAVSHINDSRSSVYIFPTKLDSNKNFAGFGDRKLVWDHGSSEGRRGAIITADFANETLMLDRPVHSMSPSDTSYVTLLQAMPYHIDNVDIKLKTVINNAEINGKVVDYPVNYTFSGFKGDEGNGQMSVTYKRHASSSGTEDAKFSMASTTETISLLGDAGTYAQGYLSLRTMQANIAGNFDSRAKAAADTMNTIMDFVTDKIDSVNEQSSTKAYETIEKNDVEALLWDTIIKYEAQQHIWRYKILNDPLPSWYKLGEKADYASNDLQPEAQVHTLTFTIYDTPTKKNTTSEEDNTYQARHEEGNLFSYPSALDESKYDGVEGYNADGELIDRTWITWSKGRDASSSVEFIAQKIESIGSSETSKPSEISKTLSAVGSFVNKAWDTVKGWFGASAAENFKTADIANLFGGSDMADSTTNAKNFTKSLSSSEEIAIGLYGRSTIPGEEAGHMIMTMPYIAKEGTLKVAHAVNLLRNSMSRLWGANSIYSKLPDPALVLPKKFLRCGASIQATTNNASAMQARGIRFYIPAADMYTTENLVAGLTYDIRIPLYNASFLDTGNFKVKLSYATTDEFNTDNPRTEKSKKALHEIQTITTSLYGWGQNKGWAVFTWTVPDDMPSKNYVFFVQIDPDHEKQEVHEERLDDAGNTVDIGGNNEGYFTFSVTSKKDLESKYTTAAAIMAGEYKPKHSNGVICSAMFTGAQYDADGGKFRAAVETLDRTGMISADVRLNDWESDEDNATLVALMALMYQLAGVSEDYTVPVKFTVTYEGDTYYPEAYLQGVNLKPGAAERLRNENARTPNREDIESVFSVHRMALVPHTTVSFIQHLMPLKMDWENGSVFEFYVPDLAAASVLEEIANSSEEASEGEESSGDDTSGDDQSGEDPGTVTPTTSTVGSSGGGCDTLAGSFVLLGLAGLALLRHRKHQ